MEEKGLIKTFAILFGLVSIYQLSFTFIANNVEKQAQINATQKISTEQEDYIGKRGAEVNRYLDSIGSKTVYDFGIASYTYNEVKEKELNKGLDLKGGINVILQISVKDILKGLSNYTTDIDFGKALAEADERSKSSDADYIELFFESFEDLSPDKKLSSPNIFATKTLNDEINFQMTNDEVKPIIRKKIDESIVSAFEVLRKRIDKFGVTQPNIQRLGSSGRILVELPGAKDISRIKTLLKSTARLEFWHTYKNTELIGFIGQANERLKTIISEDEQATLKTNVSQKDTLKSQIDSLLTSAESDLAKDSLDLRKTEPLLGLIVEQSYQNSPIIGSFAVKDTSTVNAYLKKNQIRNLLPPQQKNLKFVWGKVAPNSELIDLYALKFNRQGIPPLSGSVIVDASQNYDINNNPSVSMQMNGKGSRKWEEITGQAYKEQGNIAIVLDEVVYSAPGVSTGAISGGRSEITGNFTLNEAIDLANVLRAGKLPASAEIIQSEIVGPSLGQEAIDSGINSFIIAMIIVLMWMVFYYGRAGIIADTSLVFNILLIFGILAGLGAVLTLPGIAGIVLTIGMSVDANVIIFERIKEELKKGKSQKRSVNDGFKNALSSILDANITTGLTALILLVFGTGPIKGFATTLLIGILTSLFTAIFISKLIIDRYISRNNEFKFQTPLTKGLFQNTNIRFLKKRKLTYVISSILVILSLFSLSTNGLNQGVDFVGGRSYQIRFETPVSPTELNIDLEKAFQSSEVKTFGAPNQIKFTTKYKVNEESSEVDEEIQKKLFDVLLNYLPDGLTYDEFVSNDGEKSTGIMSSIKVGPTIADDVKINALWAIIGSLFVVFLYILLRFLKWQYSASAVIAVFHDVIIVLGVFSLTYAFMPFNMEIDQAFIAAILTVIGYSLNDTVVVFDRIREYSREKGVWKSEKVTDLSLNSTLSRTLNTSITTLVVLVSIFIFGGESLRGFIFAMIIGVTVGTYSSIFIASPIMYDFLNSEKKENTKPN